MTKSISSLSTNQLSIWNEHMLEFMKTVINSNGARNQQDFCETIGFTYTNLRQVKNGAQGFRHEHFLAACKTYNANMNWFYGLEKEMYRPDKKTKPIDLLKAAVQAVENELKGKKQKE